MMYVFASVLEFIDAAIAGALDAGIRAFINAMFLPAWLSLTAFLWFRGWQAMSGNLPAVTTDVLREAVGLIFTVCLATNIDLFNTYIRDFFFFGLPQFLAGIASTVAAEQGTNVQPGSMGQQLTVLWAHVWKACGVAWKAASGWGDWPIFATVIVTLAVAAVALIICVLIYLVSHFFLALMVMMGPLFILLATFRATRGYLDRWGGKMVSLILLQVMAVLVMAFVARAQLTFMEQINSAEAISEVERRAATDARQSAQRSNMANRGASFYSEGPTPTLNASPNGIPADTVMDRLQGLFGVLAMFLLGGSAMVTLPYFAYSLGSGLMVNPMPRTPSLPMPGFPGGGAGAAPTPNLGVSFNQPGGGGVAGGIPQPAPPSYASLAPSPPTPLGATP